MRLNTSVTLLIVIESGSLCPSWLGESEGHLSVLRQGPTETLADLASRVARTLEQADARGDSIASAIFLQSDRSDANAILARVRIAGAIVEHFSRCAAGRLVIVPGGVAGGSARIQASLLVDCLRFQTRDLEDVTVVTSYERDDVASEYEDPETESDRRERFGQPRLRAAA